jgi:nucleoside 2-deoxyribosyltransferase
VTAGAGGLDRRVYLAGPEVFLADPTAIAERKKALCAAHGFVGVFPLDARPDRGDGSGPAVGRGIAVANEALLRSCDLLIANMTPFRGPGMDGGTAYEMGFMRALGRPVLGYTTVGGDFAARTRAFLDGRLRSRPGGGEEDADGLLIEDFGLVDNLMMAAAATTGGATVPAIEGPLDGLDGLEACLRQARRVMADV